MSSSLGQVATPPTSKSDADLDAFYHPLDPLSPDEIRSISRAVRTYISTHVEPAPGSGSLQVAIAKDVKQQGEGNDPKESEFVKSGLNPNAILPVHVPLRFQFKEVALVPPNKREVLRYLGIPSSVGELEENEKVILKANQSSLPEDGNGELRARDAVSRPERKALIDVLDMVTGKAYNLRLTLNTDAKTEGEWKVTKCTALPESVHPHFTIEDLIRADEAVRNNPEIIKLAGEMGIKPDQLCADAWSIGYDDRFPQSQRVHQCVLFARLGEDDNHYAHPLDFCAILDSLTLKLLHVDFASHRLGPNGTISASGNTTASPTLSDPSSSLEAANRPRIHPPLQPADYLSEKLGVDDMRKDIKPLHVLQPEGVSFKLSGGHVLEWQKWRMHVAFSGREGIIISTVTYNDGGLVRPLFYRLSLAEMVVPYAAPEHPHNRKFAFDVGEFGMGYMANDLSLGCDCLGSIMYLPGSYVNHAGDVVNVNNAICIHESDDGLLFKHTDFRPGGKPRSARSRRLSISMVCTVGNYEYLFFYHFAQDGSITFEVRLTGILSVYLLAPSESALGFGTTVAPQINAQHHQHLFSLLIDPMIDGLSNTVIESDLVALPQPTHSSENYAGNGFESVEKVLKDATTDGSREYDADKDRRWTIVNQGRKHHASGKPVGYGIRGRGAMVKLFAKEDSWIAKRAGFAKKGLWVVREQEEETGDQRVYPAGRYPLQTRTAPEDSVEEWVKDGKPIENADIVLFLTIGCNHVPRPEDWPVMPAEKMEIMLKPIGFFKCNPALDVPGLADQRSVQLDATTSCGNGCEDRV